MDGQIQTAVGTTPDETLSIKIETLSRGDKKFSVAINNSQRGHDEVLDDIISIYARLKETP